MYIPSITKFPEHPRPRSHSHPNPIPRPQKPKRQLVRMSSVLRRRALLLGVGAVGVGLVATGKLGPSKKQAVIWEISGELDKANTGVDEAREAAFGYVAPFY